MKTLKIVRKIWEEVQFIQDKEGFDSNSYLIEDEQGLKDFGSGSYFVNKDWYENLSIEK